MRNKIKIFVGGSITSYLLHFPARFLDDWVMGELQEMINTNLSTAVSVFITWVLPFLLIFGAIWLGYRIRNPKLKTIPDMSMVNHPPDSSKSYVDKLIVDSKSNDLLGIPVALQALSELDYGTYQKLKLIKRSDTIVKSIQSQLRQDWKTRPTETFENLDEKMVRATIENTIKNLKLETGKLDENTMMFMLHVAGVLDDHKIGISKYRENDERYLTVNRLKAKVETHELRNVIRTYNWYSIGMCSMLLLVDIFPFDSVQSIQKRLGKTSTELKAEREDTLGYIMVGINSMVRVELHGKRK